MDLPEAFLPKLFLRRVCGRISRLTGMLMKLSADQHWEWTSFSGDGAGALMSREVTNRRTAGWFCVRLPGRMSPPNWR
jgi:hypothetical protein